METTPIIGFENNTVLPPKDRFSELPLVFQTYLEKVSFSVVVYLFKFTKSL